jgi:hypothetical protein
MLAKDSWEVGISGTALEDSDTIERLIFVSDAVGSTIVMNVNTAHNNESG